MPHNQAPVADEREQFDPVWVRPADALARHREGSFFMIDLECSLFGGLYQWDEMMQYVTSEGARGICPAGWHLPTNAEWTTLTDYLGGESVAGVQMKSTSGWYNNGNGINSHGFFGRPGGSRNYYGHFYNLSMNADFWSSSQDSTLFSWYRFLSYNLESVGKGSISKMNGFSARCLQD